MSASTAYRWAAFGLAFWACVEAGHLLTFPDPIPFATFWPASGLYLAVLAMSPKRHWPGYIVVGLAVNALTELVLRRSSVPLTLAYCTANTLEALAGGWLLQRVHGRPFQAHTLSDTLWMAGAGALAATMVGAMVGGAAVTELIGARPLSQNIAVWWMADAVGVLTVAPLLLTFAGQAAWKRRSGPALWLEGAATGMLLVMSSWIAFGPKLALQREIPAYPFVVAPFLIWCGLRFGQFGTAIGVFLAAIVAVWGTTRGYGLFARMEHTLELKAAALQIYLAVVTVTPLLFATVIQQQRLAEDRLTQNLKLLEAVMDGTSDAVFVKDLSGRYLLMNGPGAQMLGKTADEVIGGDDFALFDTATARRIQEEDRRTIREAQTRSYEAEVSSAGSSAKRHFHTTKGPYRDAQGRVVGVVGIARDITDLKQAEEVLRASEAKSRAMFAMAADAVVWIDERGTIEAFNPSAERMFGYAADEIVGRNVKTIMPPPYRDEHDGYLENYLRTGERKVLGISRELVGLRRNGTQFPLELVVSEVLQGNRRTFSGVVRDITERRLAQQTLEGAKSELERRVAERTAELVDANQQLRREMTERSRAEERLRDQQLQLAHAARLSSLGQMAAELAHELNQPLSAIINYIRGTQRRSQAGNLSLADVLPTLEIVHKEAVRAAEVIRRTKSFVRKQPPGRRPLDLGRIVGEAIAIVQHELHERGVEVRIELEPARLKCLGDDVQLQQVVVNLVLNAADAVQSVPPEQRQVRLSVRRHEDQLELAVSDNGPGIETPAADRIFETYFSTKPEGLGLGLPISRSIIEGHGGRLWADQGPMGGACFHLTLPAWEGPDDDVDDAGADRVRGG